MYGRKITHYRMRYASCCYTIQGIGLTGYGNAILSNRLKQISNTKSLILVQCVKVLKTKDAENEVKALHSILHNERIERDWFYDEDDNLIDCCH